jgi:Domain of unknown function (DUF1929)/Bacterial Ig-like domain (group 2)
MDLSLPHRPVAFRVTSSRVMLFRVLSISLLALGITACQNPTPAISKLNQSISITPNPASSNIGTNLRFVAIVRDKDNNLLSPQPALRWISSAPDRASIDPNSGLATGIASGETTITVQGAGINSSVQFTVCAAGCQQPIRAISIAPEPASVVIGGQLVLSANAKDASGDQLNPQPGFQWSSSDPNIIEVNAAGMASGLKLGTATITASSGGVQGTMKIKVTLAGNSTAHTEGQWSSIKTWPTLPIHATLMPDGSLETWGWRRTDPFNKSQPTTLTDRWNPTTDTHSTRWETKTDLFGAGHELLEDGRLMVASGSDPVLDEWVGINNVNLLGSAWSVAKSMNIYRWYPTVTALPNGEVLVTGGSDEKHDGNYLHEVFTPSSNTWRSLSTAIRRPNHTENFVMPPYPYMHVAPDGRVFYAGPTPWTAYLTTSGTGQWEDGEYAGRDFTRLYGSSVQFDEGKVLVMGGSVVDVQADAGAVVLDMTKNGRASPTAPMNAPRRNLNATVLPDGTVLVTGGNDLNYDQGRMPKYAEVWDSNTGEWTVLAEQQIPRPYHSVGLLLPDATVFTGGGYDGDKNSNRYENPGDPKQVKYRNAEIFAPPYLFKKDGSGNRAERPQIQNAPTSINYKQNFSINVSSSATIAKLSLIKLGSVTHGFNFGQRLVKLKFNRSGGTFNVTAPTNANLAPPGYYMLFAVDTNGVPSIASMIQVKR